MGARILFLAMNLNSGGAERQMVSTAVALQRCGYTVSFVCYDKGDFFESTLIGAGIKITWIIEQRSIVRLLKFRRYIRTGHYDIVVSFLETANILNLFAAIGLKRWGIITGERSSRKENLLSLRGHIVAIMQSWSNAIVCNSYNAKSMWESVYPGLKSKLTVIYNGIEVEEIRSDHDHSRGVLKIVVAASYRAEKNPINLIEAIGLMDEHSRSRIQIEWFGAYDFPGSVYEQCRSRVMQLSLSSVIHLNGPTKEISRYMAEADFVALFSKYEGLPNSICEAMMLGKPIIMTKVSDYSTIVRDNGFLCDSDDPEGIRAVIEQAINITTAACVKMGDQSKRIAESLFSSKKSIDSWVELSDRL